MISSAFMILPLGLKVAERRRRFVKVKKFGTSKWLWVIFRAKFLKALLSFFHVFLFIYFSILFWLINNILLYIALAFIVFVCCFMFVEET